jgi:hypothetical protein
MLLRAGADPDARTEATAEYLLRRGADINTPAGRPSPA